jgi:hypothetical protein
VLSPGKTTVTLPQVPTFESWALTVIEHIVNSKNTKKVKLTGLIVITEIISAKIFPKCYLNVNINMVNVNIMLRIWAPILL